jgi:hypothetical protein
VPYEDLFNVFSKFGEVTELNLFKRWPTGEDKATQTWRVLVLHALPDLWLCVRLPAAPQPRPAKAVALSSTGSLIMLELLCWLSTRSTPLKAALSQWPWSGWTLPG